MHNLVAAILACQNVPYDPAEKTWKLVHKNCEKHIWPTGWFLGIFPTAGFDYLV
jgi:hypothetical protein